MKTITNTEVWAELTSARDELAALYTRLYEFNRRVCQEDTAEARLLAASLRECQQAMIKTEERINVVAACYAE